MVCTPPSVFLVFPLQLRGVCPGRRSPLFSGPAALADASPFPPDPNVWDRLGIPSPFFPRKSTPWRGLTPHIEFAPPVFVPNGFLTNGFGLLFPHVTSLAGS